MPIFTRVYDHMRNTFHKKLTRQLMFINSGTMMPFRILIILCFLLGFYMLDKYVAGQHAIMIGSGGPEMFPILLSRKYLHF